MARRHIRVRQVQGLWQEPRRWTNTIIDVEGDVASIWLLVRSSRGAYAFEVDANDVELLAKRLIEAAAKAQKLDALGRPRITRTRKE